LQDEIMQRNRGYDTLQAERDGLKGQVSEAVMILQQAVMDSVDKPADTATIIDLAKYIAKEVKESGVRIKARMALEEIAKKYNVKFDEKTTDRKIREDIITSLGGTTKFDEKSDEYVESAFDFALNSDTAKTHKVGDQRTLIRQPPKQNAPIGAAAAREKMVNKIRIGRSV
jgi:hypothetical protein